MNSPILMSIEFLKALFPRAFPGPQQGIVLVRTYLLFWKKRKEGCEAKVLHEESQQDTKKIHFVNSLSIQASNHWSLMGRVAGPPWVTVSKRTLRLCLGSIEKSIAID